MLIDEELFVAYVMYTSPVLVVSASSYPFLLHLVEEPHLSVVYSFEGSCSPVSHATVYVSHSCGEHGCSSGTVENVSTTK